MEGGLLLACAKLKFPNKMQMKKSHAAAAAAAGGENKRLDFIFMVLIADC